MLLASRAVLRVSGSEALKLLQGITTQKLVPASEDVRPRFSAMLNSQGRMLADFIVVPQEGHFLLDCEREASDIITKTIQQFIMRRDVRIDEVTADWAVSAMPRCRDEAAARLALAAAGVPGDALASLAQDPRCAQLGWRSLHRRPAEGATGDEGEYDLVRMAAGVPQGLADFAPREALGPECSLDWLNGLSFKKGCYIGQELIARTYARGAIRKRYVPVVLAASAAELPLRSELEHAAAAGDFAQHSRADARLPLPPPGCRLLTEAGKSAGVLRSSRGNRAIALVRLRDAFSADGTAQALRLDTAEALYVRPYAPAWWPAGAASASE